MPKPAHGPRGGHGENLSLPDYGGTGGIRHEKISSYIWDYRFSYLGAVLSLLIAVTLDMAAPRLTAHVVDDVIVGGNIGELKFLLLGFLGVGLGRCIFQYVKEYTFDKTEPEFPGTCGGICSGISSL